MRVTLLKAEYERHGIRLELLVGVYRPVLSTHGLDYLDIGALRRAYELLAGIRGTARPGSPGTR
ncbi:hypothetical protein K490DRAFT_67444 [Saccharata proteae CBS 121410]|uniref:Uncharacterized protein n=1 Tax=Saccharata proteae CBS 121410 TaxID=1314787 RepID=A0A9P4HSP2_9PEZI|nr:hypothetical protein K490DRAFT_67444 [Saccharata proteae CBS 121410]